MSWSDDWEGIGHVNCLSRPEFIAPEPSGHSVVVFAVLAVVVVAV